MFDAGKTRTIGLPYGEKLWWHVKPFSSDTGTSRTELLYQYHESVCWRAIKINIKNFHGSLTTVVRAQKDTFKTAYITDTIFDRTYRLQSTAFCKWLIYVMVSHVADKAVMHKLLEPLGGHLMLSNFVEILCISYTCQTSPFKHLCIVIRKTFYFWNTLLTTCSRHLCHCYIISNSLS